MEVKSVTIYKRNKYLDDGKWQEYYAVTVNLEDSRETKVEVNLTDAEQGKLFEALSEILPAKLNEFSADFAKSLRSDDNAEKD